MLALARRYGHELFGLEETQALLDALERTHPALVREVVPKLISPVLLTDVLRRLVEEGISLRNLRDILGALAEWAPQERDPVALTEHVRVALRRAITYKHAGDAGVLAAYLLDPMIEDAIREGIQKTATGSYLALEPQISRDIIAAVGRALGPGGRERRRAADRRRDPPLRPAPRRAGAPRPSPCCRSRSWRPRRRSARSRASASGVTRDVAGARHERDHGRLRLS